MLFSVRDGREYFLKITNCSPSGKKKPTHFVLVKRYFLVMLPQKPHGFRRKNIEACKQKSEELPREFSKIKTLGKAKLRPTYS